MRTDEVIQQIAERTGLPLDKAGAALQAVMEVLRDKLPGPLGEQVEALLSGEGGGDALGGLLGGLGGLLGGSGGAQPSQ